MFEQNPELSKIGSQKQYSQYIETIFPESKVRDIVYHRTDAYFEEFDKSFISKDYDGGLEDKFYFLPTGIPEFFKTKRTIAAILDMKTYTDFFESGIYKTKDNIRRFDDGDLEELGVNEPEQIHILGSKSDIEGFRKFIESESKEYQEPISDTEKVDEIYSPLFTKINDDNLEEDEDSEPLMDSDTFEQERGYLSDEEKSQFETKPFANLTQTLVYQLEDINNEIAELDGRMNNSSKTEFKQLSKNKAKLLLTKSDIISKIKEAKQLNNLWQVVDFGNDAVEEVSKLMSDGNLTIKGLRYAERIANF